MDIPTPEQVRAELAALSYSQLLRLAEVSGVPFGTLQKVARGDTPNPRLNTVRGVWPHLAALKQAA
jgi:predicted transcriptional regulator